uniref:PNPLA domain-containing protein n=1 Tax=Xiphophorus maculatus TaxID=8083 RepID=A0A3B5QB79_XIPMA
IKEWSISFAGCGFMGIYYVGVISCILQRFPRFIRDASTIYGASAGALMAAIITLGIPLGEWGFSPSFWGESVSTVSNSSFNEVLESLLEKLPEDAHLRVSGKLSLSLTRVSDGRNLLVSQFDSREELIQALICSCFVPLYCGVVPPTYRGVYYVDGAVSDNLPRCQLGRTITISPCAGESDLCPRVNSENLYRVTSTFFPPEAEVRYSCSFPRLFESLSLISESWLISLSGELN